MALLYVAEKELPCPWNKPGELGIYEGIMNYYKPREENVGVNQWISDNHNKYPEMANEIEKFCAEATKFFK